mgnify:CR=1 FL=1
MAEDVQALVANSDLRNMAQIMRPKESDPPILMPTVREAVRQWMIEMAAEAELRAVGLKPRRTALFYGPPGTGKTTLAHHIAARAGLPLVLIDMSALVGMYLGETGKNINRLFRAVEDQHDRMVLLLDEFDAVASKRGVMTNSGGEREMNAVVIHLLQFIDKFPGMLIAATNRADGLDPAIWRRFGMCLEIADPDDDCRFAILARYLDPMKLPDQSMDTLVDLTSGASPALLRMFAEGIKRDLVLAPRYSQDVGAAAVIGRVTASVRPHEGSTIPPLWRDRWAIEEAGRIAWPPTLGGAT